MGEPRLLLRAGRGEVAALSDLYDHHGAALYRLAFAMKRDARTAESAVRKAFQLALAEAESAPGGRHDLQELAAHVFTACQADQVGSHPRDPGFSVGNNAPVETQDAQDMLALTIHGGHTYREAAFLLRLDAPTAAALLRSTLLALSVGGPERQTGDPGMTTQAVDAVAFTHPLARVAPKRYPSLTVSVVSTADLDVISVAGEIDLDTLPLLHRELWKVRGQDRNHLLVDLTAVTFMDAGALGLLVAVQQWVNASHGSLSLRLNARGARLMRLTHLIEFFTIEGERPCARVTP